MAALFLLISGIAIYICCNRKHNRIKQINKKVDEFIRKTNPDYKPSRQKKKHNSEDEELFFTDLGNFDDTFK